MLAVGCSDRFEDAPASPDSMDGSREASDPVLRADAALESSDEVATPEAEEASVAIDGSVDVREEAEDATEAGPAPIPTEGLLLWLRADAGVTAGQDAIVTGWANQSPSHFDAWQSVLGKQPQWSSGAASDRAAVIFDEDDYLSLPAGFTDFSLGISVFAVAQIANTAPCADVLALSNGAEVDDIALGRHNGKAHYEVYNGDFAGDDLRPTARK